MQKLYELNKNGGNNVLADSYRKNSKTKKKSPNKASLADLHGGMKII